MFDAVNSATETTRIDFLLNRRVVNDSGIAVKTTVAAHTDTRKPIWDVLTLRSAAIDGSIPVGKNSDVTVAKTVKPMADIAAHGNFSVVEFTMTTLVPTRYATELRLTGANRAKRSENGDEIDNFLHRCANNRGEEAGGGDTHEDNTESDSPPD